MAYKLSLLIPARNEFYYDLDLLGHTVQNALENTTDACEIVVVLDGYWPLTPLPSNPRLTVIHHNKSIGQRAATNEAARIARGDWVCKLDAHSALDKDFDAKIVEGIEDDWTVVGGQYNLQAFQWRCKSCGWLKDQSPKPERCGRCNSKFVKLVPLWFPRDGRDNSNGVGGKRTAYTHSWYFDTTLTFGYWGEYAADEEYCKRHKIQFRPETQAEVHDIMCLLGACWAMRRERYWELDACDEKFGSWGNQGVEIAIKSWLSGGRLVVNRRTWFAHFFRVGGIGFPYPDGGRKERAVARSKELWFNNSWPKQVRPLSWLIDHFAPTKDWSTPGNAVMAQVQEAGKEFYKRKQSVPYNWGEKLDNQGSVVLGPTKAILYYTCNSHDLTLEIAARNNLKRGVNGHELGCVSRERTDFGDWNIVVDRERSGTTMHYQILAGLERSTADYVFLCESDVFYHPSHFDFTPPDDSVFYYNTNVWRIRYSDGHAVRTDNLQQVSGICANRKLLLEHYRKRIEMIEANGGKFDIKRMAYEPGTRGKFGDEKVANWESEFPNIDVTDHGHTLTKPKFSVDEFRNARYARGWTETDDALPGWPKLSGGGLQQLLEELANGQSINIKQAG
jgi:glycosyltransferase involved in cell wall biosynthesis